MSHAAQAQIPPHKRRCAAAPAWKRPVQDPRGPHAAAQPPHHLSPAVPSRAPSRAPYRPALRVRARRCRSQPLVLQDLLAWRGVERGFAVLGGRRPSAGRRRPFAARSPLLAAASTSHNCRRRSGRCTGTPSAASPHRCVGFTAPVLPPRRRFCGHRRLFSHPALVPSVSATFAICHGAGITRCSPLTILLPSFEHIRTPIDTHKNQNRRASSRAWCRPSWARWPRTSSPSPTSTTSTPTTRRCSRRVGEGGI